MHVIFLAERRPRKEELLDSPSQISCCCTFGIATRYFANPAQRPDGWAPRFFPHTCEDTKKDYYCPCLTADVARYVSTCRGCQRRKTQLKRPMRFIQPVDPPRRPFQQIGMDFQGPFLSSTSGCKWIVVATDYPTCYAETFALPKGSAAEVVRFFFENILLRHGAAEVLMTDRGTAFTADLTQAILKYSLITAYHNI